MKRSILVWGFVLLVCAGGTYPEDQRAPLVAQLSNLALVSTSGLNLTHDDLLCGFDLEGDATTAATAWYSGTSSLALVMAFHLPMEGGVAQRGQRLLGQRSHRGNSR